MSLQDPGRGLHKIVAEQDTSKYRSFYIAADGTIDATGDDGHKEIAIPVFAGSVIPSRFSKIHVISGAVIYGIS